MSAEAMLSDSVASLLERQGAEVLAELQHRYRSALDDNPEGSALIYEALRAALLAGVSAQCELDGERPGGLEARSNAWQDWQRAKDQTPEALDWPDELAASAPGAVAQAGDLLDAAGRELGFHKSWLYDLGVGEELAEAGGRSSALSRARPCACLNPCSRNPPAWVRCSPTATCRWRSRTISPRPS
jgi:hypothetical protein